MAASGDSAIFNLVVYRAADFRFIRLVHSDTQPPPLAYMGDWSHNPEYCTEVNMLALWCVLKAKEHRIALTAWLNGEPACVLELPPFSRLRLDIKLSVCREDDRYMVTGALVFAQLPNLAWLDDTGTRVVQYIPSLFSLAHNDDVRIDNVCDQLLIASPHLRKAVSQGSELWRDASVRSGLLIAPPGSGKEVLADFLHAGNVLFRRDKDEAKFQASDIAEKDHTLSTIQFAGYDSSDIWRRDLYGELLPRKDVPVQGQQDNDNNSEQEREVRIEDLVWRNGLLRRARGTTVFFDEIDKASENVLRALLRFLENDEVSPQGGPTFSLGKGEGKEADCFKCLRLFAGSKSRNDMFALNPPDFWTRIQFVLDMVHPLEIHNEEDRCRCLQEYTLMFLFRSIDPDEAINEGDARKSLASVLCAINNAHAPSLDDLRRIAPLIASMEYPYLYLNAEYARNLSQQITEFLVWIPSARLNIRNLKALIKRLDARIRYWVTYEFDSLETKIIPNTSSKDPFITELEALLERPEIDPLFKTELGGTIAKLSARHQDRHRRRDWIWAQLHHIILEVFDA